VASRWPALQGQAFPAAPGRPRPPWVAGSAATPGRVDCRTKPLALGPPAIPAAAGPLACRAAGLLYRRCCRGRTAAVEMRAIAAAHVRLDWLKCRSNWLPWPGARGQSQNGLRTVVPGEDSRGSRGLAASMPARWSCSNPPRRSRLGPCGWPANPFQSKTDVAGGSDGTGVRGLEEPPVKEAGTGSSALQLLRGWAGDQPRAAGCLRRGLCVCLRLLDDRRCWSQAPVSGACLLSGRRASVSDQGIEEGEPASASRGSSRKVWTFEFTGHAPTAGLFAALLLGSSSTERMKSRSVGQSRLVAAPDPVSLLQCRERARALCCSKFLAGPAFGRLSGGGPTFPRARRFKRPPFGPSLAIGEGGAGGFRGTI